MAKRESVESKIITYFSEESDEKVNLLFGIIKGIVAKRTPKKKAAKPAAVPVKLAAPEPGHYAGHGPAVDSKAS